MKHVQLEVEDAIVRITLDDPPTLNALGEVMAGELREAVRFAADPRHRFRCLVLTGAGRAFCSGGSLALMTGEADGERQPDRVSLGTHHHYVIKMLKALPYPVVTAVNGPAAGLGFSYALAGDLIVAARSAFFLAAFSELGVSADGGLSWLLPRLVGWARARELLLLGGRLPAERALEWGLINRVYDDGTFAEQTAQLARELADGPTVALGRLRRLAWESWALGFEQHLDEEERLQLETFASEDAREGATARLQKRKPVFRGC